MDYLEVRLYHNEVYMPSCITKKVLALEKMDKEYTISNHFMKAHTGARKEYKHDITPDELMECVMNLKNEPVEPFEVELSKLDDKNWKVTKYVVRKHFDETRDISIVIRNNVIITAWLNSIDDVHCTLDASKYVGKK